MTALNWVSLAVSVVALLCALRATRLASSAFRWTPEGARRVAVIRHATKPYVKFSDLASKDKS